MWNEITCDMPCGTKCGLTCDIIFKLSYNLQQKFMNFKIMLFIIFVVYKDIYTGKHQDFDQNTLWTFGIGTALLTQVKGHN